MDSSIAMPLNFMINIVYLFLLMFVVIIMLSIFEKEGKDRAEDLLELHEKNSERVKVKIIINDEEKELTYLGCGAKNCAGIEPVSNRVYYFPHSSSFSYILKK